MQPINYLLSGQSPFEALMGGMDGFQKYDNNKLVLEQNRIANQSAQDKADYVKLAQQEAQTLDYNDPNAIRKFIAKYESSGITKGMTDYVANLDDKDRQTMLADTSKGISLLRSGDSANAAQFARDKATAYKNAGMASKADEYEQIASMIETHPNAALQSLQMTYAVAAGKDDMKGYHDFITANTPTVKDINSGGEIGGYVIDPITGEVTYKKLVDTSVSPDEQLRANTSITNNTNDNETRVTTANIAADTSRYAADKSSYTGITVANINNRGANYRSQLQANIEAQKLRMQQEQSQLVTGTDGKAYVFYPNRPTNKFEPYYGKDGKQMIGEAGKGAVVGTNKPMPASALTLVANSRSNIQSSQNTIAKIDQSLKDLDPNTGKLKLGLLSNAGNVASNWASKGDESSLAYERLVSNRAGLVNEVLTMAKGTQTEGDAQRAAKVVMSIPLTDNNAVINAFSELRRVALRTVALEQGKIEEVYQNYGKTPPNDLYASTQPTTAKPQQQASSKSLAARDKHFTGK